MTDRNAVLAVLDELAGHDVQVFIGGHEGDDGPAVPAAGFAGELRPVEPEFLEAYVFGGGADAFYVDGGQDDGNLPFVAVSAAVTLVDFPNGVAWWQGGTFVGVQLRAENDDA